MSLGRQGGAWTRADGGAILEGGGPGNRRVDTCTGTIRPTDQHAFLGPKGSHVTLTLPVSLRGWANRSLSGCDQFPPGLLPPFPGTQPLPHNRPAGGGAQPTPAPLPFIHPPLPKVLPVCGFILQACAPKSASSRPPEVRISRTLGSCSAPCPAAPSRPRGRGGRVQVPSAGRRARRPRGSRRCAGRSGGRRCGAGRPLAPRALAAARPPPPPLPPPSLAGKVGGGGGVCVCAREGGSGEESPVRPPRQRHCEPRTPRGRIRIGRSHRCGAANKERNRGAR